MGSVELIWAFRIMEVRTYGLGGFGFLVCWLSVVCVSVVCVGVACCNFEV